MCSDMCIDIDMCTDMSDMCPDMCIGMRIDPYRVGGAEILDLRAVGLMLASVAWPVPIAAGSTKSISSRPRFYTPTRGCP